MQTNPMPDDIPYIQSQQKKISALVTKRFKRFYLTGGTALSFLFKHRFSEDLDFFTQAYSPREPDHVMKVISDQTGFPHELKDEQNGPKLVPMKVFNLQLKGGRGLKIDFVQDYAKNLGKVKGGLHSVDDIYLRKIVAAIGQQSRETEIGMPLPTGRQSVKDVFDLYTLSRKKEPLTEFFLRHFSPAQAERLMAWYRGFNRMDLKLELLDTVPGADTGELLQYLDDEILRRLPDALINHRR